MSDFFAGLSGVRFPEVVMNQGPLPGAGGLPNPLHDTVDGRINYNSSLLGDLEPYAYGEPGYLSSQNAYLNIPHRVQKIVPYLFLPSPDGSENFRLDHPIDDGDVAFVMRLDRHSEICSGLSNKTIERAGLGMAIDPMINLCTLNYLLAGVQLCTRAPSLRRKWDLLLYYLDKQRFASDDRRAYDLEDLHAIVRNLIKPFGIAHGSEKQGGQHEGSMSPATWPVNFVITLTLDGKDANVVNVWHKHDIEAGNDLVFRLKPMPLPAKYTLNHWHKNLVEKSFGASTMQAVKAGGGGDVTHVWQLVPDIFSLDLESVSAGGLSKGFEPKRDYCWQQEGYWHIARSQVHSRSYGHSEFYNNDLANNLRTGHMDLTFQPTFYAIPYRDPARQSGPAVAVRGAEQNVFNLLGAPKRDWESALRLEQGFGAAEPKRGRVAERLDAQTFRGPSDGDCQPLMWDPAFFGAAWMDTGPPLPEPSGRHDPDGGLREPAGSSQGVFEESRREPVFSVPKPGLKAAGKRPAAKGRGVLSSVLAADGSVTQEQSRML